MARPVGDSFANNGSPWGSPTHLASNLEEEIDPAMIVAKEQLVKEIGTGQDSLRALLQRISEVQLESSKQKSNNEMLQTYIDNLTRNSALAAGGKR